MCNQSGIEFCKKNINVDHIHKKKILEVGAANINGSLRHWLETFKPYSYTGVDISNDPNVDFIVKAEDLVEHFGAESFDFIICTEVIEHISDWKNAINNFKNVLSPNGRLILTTRSIGFPYHGYPFDYWRFSLKDFKTIFNDFSIISLENDSLEPGVFLYAQKPEVSRLLDLSDYKVWSIISGSKENISFVDEFQEELPDLSRLDWRIKRFLSRLPVSFSRKIQHWIKNK